jgi:hypothetical protein
MAVYDLGLVCKRGNNFDCDVIEVSSSGEWVDRKDDIEWIRNQVDLATATLIVATKVSWWLTNHHTGGSPAVGYTAKVLGMFFKDLSPVIGTTLAHTIGHWASTIKVLNIADIHTRHQVTFVCVTPNNALVLADDCKKRFSSMPAETHRLAVAYEGAKRLFRSALGKVCPRAMELMYLPRKRKEVLRSPSMYHVGAKYLNGHLVCNLQGSLLPKKKKYLNGEAADYNDADNEGVMSRVGLFVTIIIRDRHISEVPTFCYL